MGWDGYTAFFYKNGKIDRKAECDAHYERYCRVEKSAMRGSVYYAAVTPIREYTRISTNPEVYDYVPIPKERQETFAVVCLTRVDSRRRDFWIKTMSEDMHPYYYDCPESILRLLSPTASADAQEWRRLCREKRAQKRSKPSLSALPIGAVIEFQRGERTIRVCKCAPAYQFKTAWYRVLGGNTYFQKRLIPDDFTVIPAA